MRLTRFTDYSLRVLIYLASQPGRRATVAEIADRFGVKPNHLTKVVHFLGREGWLATLRGKGGGLTLACEAQAIVVADVVRRTEGAPEPAECFEPGGGGCVIRRACRLRGVLQEASDAFYAVLADVTLADLVHNRPVLARMLHIQPSTSWPP